MAERFQIRQPLEVLDGGRPAVLRRLGEPLSVGPARVWGDPERRGSGGADEAGVLGQALVVLEPRGDQRQRGGEVLLPVIPSPCPRALTPGPSPASGRGV